VQLEALSVAVSAPVHPASCSSLLVLRQSAYNFNVAATRSRVPQRRITLFFVKNAAVCTTNYIGALQVDGQYKMSRLGRLVSPIFL